MGRRLVQLSTVYPTRLIRITVFLNLILGIYCDFSEQAGRQQPSQVTSSSPLTRPSHSPGTMSAESKLPASNVNLPHGSIDHDNVDDGASSSGSDDEHADENENEQPSTSASGPSTSAASAPASGGKKKKKKSKSKASKLLASLKGSKGEEYPQVRHCPLPHPSS
jgi:hypothetical protein